MQRARAFFYVCAGLFLLALSYHLGARNAGAQYGAQVTGYSCTNASAHFVMTANGYLYLLNATFPGGPLPASSPQLLGNFWSGGGPTPAQQQSWGAVKSRYRGERAVQPAPVGR
jgi:hypothetical protein